MVESEPHQCDYPFKPLIRVVRTSIVESHGKCLLGHWHIYECLFLTLVSVLMTVILVIAHIISAP